MPLALSNWKITKSIFTVTGVDDLATKIKDYLVTVNWIAFSMVGGWRMFCRSPQNLEAYLLIRNLGHTTGIFGYQQLTFNWQSIDGTITGMDLEIAWDTVPGETFLLIAGKSQFALAKMGVNTDAKGSSLVVSIPFIPTEIACGAVRPVKDLITQCWIAMGDHNGAGSPRKYLILGDSPFGATDQESYEGLWEVTLTPGGHHEGSLRMPMLTYAPYIFNAFNFPSDDVWATHDFFRIEPFLAWGDTNTGIPVIRGQLWDCMNFAKPFVMDYTIQMDGLNWHVYTDNYLYGVLAFIDVPGTGEGGHPFDNIGEGSNFASFIYD